MILIAFFELFIAGAIVSFSFHHYPDFLSCQVFSQNNLSVVTANHKPGSLLFRALLPPFGDSVII